MPTVEESKRFWDGAYQWADRGDEWSHAWGGQAMQWYGTILPRIHRFVPAHCILEIGCGFGRWTHFLKDICDTLIAVDLSEQCVQACRQRFSGCSHIDFHLNDGQSLSMVPDGSVDFAFTFDSLVHSDESTMGAYVSQLPRILTERGAAFVHHSNLAEYQAMLARIRKVPKLEGLLKALGVLGPTLHGRDPSVSARVVERAAEAHGLKCIGQELVTWGRGRIHIDCISTIVKAGSPLARPNRVLRNPGFMQEAANLSRLAALYASDGGPASGKS